MKLQVIAPSQVAVDVIGDGPLKALTHQRSFVATAPALSLSINATAALDVAVTFTLAAKQLRPYPDNLNMADRLLLMRNLEGKEVLNVKKYPTIAFSGRYRGNWQSGNLQGQLTLRGKSVPVNFTCIIERQSNQIHAQGEWQGKLTDLGLRPFKALLGAIQLKDWARLHFNVYFAVVSA